MVREDGVSYPTNLAVQQLIYVYSCSSLFGLGEEINRTKSKSCSMNRLVELLTYTDIYMYVVTVVDRTTALTESVFVQ